MYCEAFCQYLAYETCLWFAETATDNNTGNCVVRLGHLSVPQKYLPLCLAITLSVRLYISADILEVNSLSYHSFSFHTVLRFFKQWLK